MARQVFTISEDQERPTDPRPSQKPNLKAEVDAALTHASNHNWYMVISHLRALQAMLAGTHNRND